MKIAIGLLLFPLQIPAPSPKADLVLRNAKVVTLDSQLPEARAVAIGAGRIVFVGGEQEAEGWVGPKTTVEDLRGRLLVPGLIEGHGHLLGIGLAKLGLDLVGTSSEEEVARRVASAAKAAKEGEWILGRGWDQNDWAARAFPSQERVTAAAPRNPVLLTRVDGHAVWANRAAMELAGVGRETPDPAGGRILRDARGEPTGIFVDAAMALVRKAVPPRSREEKKRAIRLAIRECLRLGITSFHDAGADAGTISIYRELLQGGDLHLRLYVMLDGGDRPLLEAHFRKGPEVGEWLSIRSIKYFADGALGSRGAALLEDYADEPGNPGLLVHSEEEIYRLAREALGRGFQLGTHAIGDRGNRTVLDAYERALRETPEAKDPRLRIEHAQILDEADIPRFARLGVIAAMQAIHCTSDMPWVPSRIGEGRAREGAYAWRKLLGSGARIANGSDAPVESLDPLLGLYAAVTRQDAVGSPKGGWFPDQRMTREEALRSFTLDAAYAAFEEGVKGSIAVGKYADLVAFTADILTVPAAEIPKAKVHLVVLDGEVFFPSGD